jgi:DNA-binding transcriptional MerR regulator
MSYTVGRVAELAGVTVRTLHHYDDIGLLMPSERGRTGYRKYTDANLERLQQILYHRELGFALDEIASILDDTSADTATHLRRQHALLTERIERLSRMVAAVEYAMEARLMGISLTPEERFEIFGENDPAQYGAEAEQRWGHTEAFREARRRITRYTKDDLKQLNAQSESAVRSLVDALQEGLPATSAEAMDTAEAHRQQSRSGCTTARSRRIALSRRRTWPTSASARLTRSEPAVWRSTCTLRSWRMRSADSSLIHAQSCGRLRRLAAFVRGEAVAV